MIRIKNAIYVLFVIVILYMENICTNIYYMSGGVKGGESVVLCVLLGPTCARQVLLALNCISHPFLTFHFDMGSHQVA